MVMSLLTCTERTNKWLLIHADNAPMFGIASASSGACSRGVTSILYVCIRGGSSAEGHYYSERVSRIQCDRTRSCEHLNHKYGRRLQKPAAVAVPNGGCTTAIENSRLS